MKILVATPYFYPHSGGTERYTEELYSKLRELDSTIQVDIVTYNTEKREGREQYKGLNIYRVKAWEILPDQFVLPNYFDLYRLLKRLKSNKYDVVNAHTRFFDTAWWGWLAARYLGAKSVLTDHCAYHPQHKFVIVRLIAKFVDLIAIPLLGMVYNEVTVVSQATADFLINNRLGRKPKVVYGGVEISKNLSQKEHDGLIITYLGRMIPSKGPQLVLAAALKLVKEYPRIMFMFAGDGELLGEMKKSTSERIKFLGNIGRSQVADLLNKTDILVAPSTHHEGLPSVILEAGATSCAVVATDQGGTKELIKDGQTGLIIEPTEEEIEVKIRKLLRDTGLRQNMGQNLFKLVEEKFNWNKIAGDYVEFLVGLDKK